VSEMQIATVGQTQIDDGGQSLTCPL